MGWKQRVKANLVRGVPSRPPNQTYWKIATIKEIRTQTMMKSGTKRQIGGKNLMQILRKHRGWYRGK